MIRWIQAHWFLVVLLWPLITALASLLYGRLDHLPRWHAFFSLLAGMGFDIPKILDAIGRWINRTPPAPPMAGGLNPPPLHRSAPPINRRVGFGLVLAGLAGSGCMPPANVTNGFGDLAACVLANYSDWKTLLAKCSAYTLAEIEAAIQWLLADPKFRAAHPDAIEPLQERLSNVRSQMKQLKEIQ